MLLLHSSEGEVDLMESWVEDNARELLQVVVERERVVRSGRPKMLGKLSSRL